jgi:hypothetical protein
VALRGSNVKQNNHSKSSITTKGRLRHTCNDKAPAVDTQAHAGAVWLSAKGAGRGARREEHVPHGSAKAEDVLSQKHELLTRLERLLQLCGEFGRQRRAHTESV